ncbi:hypothetical protein CONLIGDRAFT_107967 [Coniochaeta ligniaria NRRL 30616]|uniref:Uncharacterized protein n=1 Tax=Coniochaeta ligniaria NRRL 30616 TaxID=1408157 RepID=A0A1J7IT11_9PEZI|nr:hypothetical protein CONLIGDRAFT_107967 [Coniochaeta ligniaria NRRL 30616]
MKRCLLSNEGVVRLPPPLPSATWHRCRYFFDLYRPTTHSVDHGLDTSDDSTLPIDGLTYVTVPLTPQQTKPYRVMVDAQGPGQPEQACQKCLAFDTASFDTGTGDIRRHCS